MITRTFAPGPRRWVLVALALSWSATACADGGTIRAVKRIGEFRVTVMSAPATLRVGAVDFSVMLQDENQGVITSGQQVEVALQSQRHPKNSMRQFATTENATNKLFRAATFELATSGTWEVEVRVEGFEAVPICFSVDVLEPVAPSSLWLAGWIGWPGVAVLLFVVREFYRRRVG